METEDQPLQWSASFKLASDDNHVASGGLHGDKIILPQSALEQLLAAVNSSATSRPHSINYSNGFGIETQRLPEPLMFRLVNPQTKAEIYAGIREFSAPDETISISPYLLEALGIQPDSIKARDELYITAHAANLPKGSYVRFRPLEAGYNPDDWKALLERQLRNNFTCLTKDTSLVVNGVNGETFRLLIDEVKPGDKAVCVVDTDIEVDIEPLNEDQARETLRKITNQNQHGDTTSSKGGELDVWKDVQGQVRRTDYVDYLLPSWDRSRALKISLSQSNPDGIVDLFVTPKSNYQRGFPRDAQHVFGSFELDGDGTKTILIAPGNIELENAEAIMISVHGADYGDDEEPIQYSLRAQAFEPAAETQNSHPQLTNGAAEHSSDEAQCSNCQQWVPKGSMFLHENFCRRNNVTCPQCKQVFQKTSSEWQTHWHCEFDEAHGNTELSKSKHDDTFHRDRQCPSCAFSTNSLSDLARHRSSICPGKIILCQFCHLEVPQEGDPFNISPEVALSGMTAHELADGARTTECHLCDKIVRLRDMETHMKHHELDKVGKTKPTICRNANCGRTAYGVGQKGQVNSKPQDGRNSLGLCGLCFGPLYVSMHDPEGKALRRRVERRYLGQLMTGCGKAHCKNEWCKTGRANSSLEPKGSSAQAALPAVKPLLTATGNSEDSFHFCVDESSQNGRKMAEMLAAEKGWELEWCIAAAEVQKADLNKMAEWLQAWAPRR